MWKRIRYVFSNEDYPWYKKLSRWLDPQWYGYLFKPWMGPKVLFCRMRGHPYEVIWFTLTKGEPDMTCTNCGEDLA